MFVFEISIDEKIAQVSFATDDYYEMSEAILSGDQEVIDYLNKWVPEQRGPFGLPVRWPEIFVADFDYLMLCEDIPLQKQFYGAVRLVAGEGQRGDWYNPKLPEGAQP